MKRSPGKRHTLYALALLFSLVPGAASQAAPFGACSSPRTSIRMPQIQRAPQIAVWAQALITHMAVRRVAISGRPPTPITTIER